MLSPEVPSGKKRYTGKKAGGDKLRARDEQRMLSQYGTRFRLQINSNGDTDKQETNQCCRKGYACSHTKE